VKRNGGGGPAYNADGTLVKGMPVVYECGALCGCPSSCANRVTQRGTTHRLEVFRSNKTEWGVRTLDLIQPGSFICEFTGDLVARSGNAAGSSTYWGGVVDPRKFPARWREWGDTYAALPDKGPSRFPQCPAPEYLLDVSCRRNFAAFICHSGAPNAFVQFVIRGDENEECPHLAVFAMETIPPMRELSIDYGIDH
jgi:euchromatic histone-lysine N-methyltransferase